MDLLGIIRGRRHNIGTPRGAADAEDYNEMGLSHVGAGRLGKAVECFERAVRLDPDYAPAHSNLGRAYREAGRGAEAVKACLKAIRLMPDDPEAYINLAKVYYDWGSYGEAIRACLKALRVAPSYPDAHYTLGLSYIDLGERERALGEYRTLQGLDAELADRLFMKIPNRGRM